MTLWTLLLLLIILKAMLCSGSQRDVYFRSNNSSDEKQCDAVNRWASCSTCLASDMDNTWCPNKRECFSNANATMAAACRHYCNKNIITKSDKCSAVKIDIPAVIFSFILLILCPLCILSGCIYVLAVRCRGSSKVAAEPLQPIPILHVSNSAVVSEIEVPVIAEVRVMPSDHIVAHQSAAGVGTVAMPVGSSPYSIRPQAVNVLPGSVVSVSTGRNMYGGLNSRNDV